MRTMFNNIRFRPQVLVLTIILGAIAIFALKSGHSEVAIGAVTAISAAMVKLAEKDD